MATGIILRLAIYNLTMSSVSCDGARGNKLLERKRLSDLHFLRKQTKHTHKKTPIAFQSDGAAAIIFTVYLGDNQHSVPVIVLLRQQWFIDPFISLRLPKGPIAPLIDKMCLL